MEAMEKEEKITADMRALVKEQIVADFVSSETGRRMALAQRGEHFTVRNHLSWDLRKKSWKTMVSE